MAGDYEKGIVEEKPRNSPSPPKYESLSDLPDEQDREPEYIDDNEDLQALPRIHHAPHSSNPPRRGTRRGSGGNGSRVSPPSRLGAIDEQSNKVAPDIPERNPKRRFHGNNNPSRHRFLTFAYYLEKEKDVPPVDAYDKVIGPNGEKFQDVRRNRPHSPPGYGRWRRLGCLGLIVAVILAIALAIGLGVGLTRRKAKSNQDTTSNSGSGTTDGGSGGNWSAPFPLGTFTIPTYLNSVSTNCTSDPGTWRCYPYTAYTPSTSSASYSPLVWQITSPDNSTLDLDISATQPTFSYPFANVPLTLANSNDNSNAAFTFTYTFRKTVSPSDSLAGTNGAATRCYYNNTQLAVRLYATAQGAGGNVTSPPAGTDTSTMDWPYAVEYEETTTEGPDCYLYVNGADTTPVDVSAGEGSCACDYRNFNLG